MSWVYTFCYEASKALAKVFYRYRVYYPERLIESGPCIVASNHVSFFDPPCVGIAFQKPIFYLARKTLFHNRFFGWLIRHLNSIPVDQERPDMASLKTIIRLVKEGQRVLIFPEGQRSADGEIGQAQPGLGLIIAKTKAPVLPVRVFGAHDALPRGKKLPRPSEISVVVGEPLDFRAELEGKETSKAQYQTMSERVVQAISSLKIPGS